VREQEGDHLSFRSVVGTKENNINKQT